MTFAKHGEEDFMQWGLAVGERDFTQLQIQHGKVGLYRQGVGWGSVDERFLRGNKHGKGA